DQLVGGARVGVAAAGSVGDADLLVALGGHSHQRAGPTQTVAALKSALRDLRFKRAPQRRRHGSADSYRIELARRLTSISEMRNRSTELRDAKLMLGAQAEHRLALGGSHRRPQAI